MGIVQDLTPTQYAPVRLVVEIRADEVLTVDSLTFRADMRILNAAGQQVWRHSPSPQITAAQRTAFLNWVLTNLTVYEGNTRWIAPEEPV